MKIQFLVFAPLWSALALAEWTSLGPFGGSATVVQADKFHVGTFVAATSDASIYRTKNSGTSWTPVYFPGQLRGILRAFIVDDRAPFVYLVGLTSEDPKYAGLYRTDDEGSTWTLLAGLAGKNVWSIATWPGDPQVIAVGAEDGVYLTRDGGRRWTAISPAENRALQPVVSLAFDPANSYILYAGTPHLPWKTIDGGISWNSAHAGMLDDSDVFSIQVDRSNRLRVFASACSGVYRSLDGGNTWRKLAGAKNASSRIYQVTRHPSDPNLVFAGTSNGLQRSADGGDTWKLLTDHPTRSIAFDPARRARIFIATDDVGLLRSEDLGKSLHPINRGFSNRRFDALSVAGGVLYTRFVTGSGDVGLLSQTAPTQWEPVRMSARQSGPKVVSILPVDSKRLLAITPDTLLASDNIGRSWMVVPAPEGVKLEALIPITGDTRKALVSTDRGLYYVYGLEESWSPAEIELRPVADPCSSCKLYRLAAVGDSLLASTSQGLMKSSDLGFTWRATSGALGRKTVKAICADPDRPGVAYVASFGTVYMTEDAGESWRPIGSEADANVAIKDMVVMPGGPDRLMILSYTQGVFAVPLE